ncbi:hypothetical protein ASPWEDRAFT_169019 [Aspergillus wentii DTO 134E9]|uniref:Uncharacterized protein n=1 Tax=Aspergillus wentii DTO 134E9 TaxID=1073089 RepID=A0A1L9RW41_ASPWE|nr:uncharacterized protein ASPWEDRAFT_169019 [Aspergillus wentii DTO 134E9]KAI9929143.1 hypothetical protein MW887_001547 [Aspergillus wentii]OJJ39160.1 hypothetical protein ASPWEDRAFT_169019 [Aspergillus wentii DTO 134E9]
MTSMVETSWPPKSPKEALLSSPSGRKKYQEMQRRRENLRSPLKRTATTPDFGSKATQLLSDGVDGGEDEEDEETLQLKLQAIEARLKLKQLQKSRGKPTSSFEDGDDSFSRPTSSNSFSSRCQDQASRIKSPHATNNRIQPDEVQVPLSPTRRPPAGEPASPRRFLLGIDKGLKGGDISLKRPPRINPDSRPTSSRLGNRESAMTRTGDIFAHMPSSAGEAPRPKSFSERMAESRSVDKSRKERTERAERIQMNRSSAFQFDKTEMEGFKAAAAQATTNPASRSPTRNRQTESFSREDILRSYNHLNSPSLKRSNTTSGARSQDRDGNAKESRSYFHRRNLKSESDTPSNPNGSQFTITDQARNENEGAVEKAPDPTKFEAYSSLNLSNRILPHSFLSRTLSDKKVLRIPDLLKTVKAPDFELPEDIDGDYVVFGIVASKSEPKQVKQANNVSTKEVDPFDDGLNNSNRYMAITLTDLKWTIDLFLFDTAFPRYYRLSEGTVIAILNPTIMPPPRNKIDTGRFSLSISSSDDKVLEVGSSLDIGFCKAVRKDGKTCQSWVDGRKTEFCDFHIDLQVRRTQSQRMGVNNGPGLFGPGGRSGSRTGFFGEGKKGGFKNNGMKPEGARYDAGSQSVYYVAPAPKSKNFSSGPSFHPTAGGQSAASLIDADEDPFIAAGMMGRGNESKEERLRRRLVSQQRERDITQRLVTSGAKGVGAEYLRARTGEQAPTPSDNEKTKPTPSTQSSAANTLGLTGFRKANTIRLSPKKRAYDGDKPHHGSVKKTRFITSKGIKEAGRDSLGGSDIKLKASQNNNNDDDDDDDLDII